MYIKLFFVSEESKVIKNGGVWNGLRGGGLCKSPLPDRQSCHRQHGF